MMNFDINIDDMELEDLRELTRNLLRLSRVDAELIKTMQNLLDLIEKPQGE
tara:strand:+ start:731 stop:883 length:153 start_codon:yes stop_codon:yes gene_type:complete